MPTKPVNLIPITRRIAQQRRRRLQGWIGGAIGWTGALLAVCIGARLSYSTGPAANAAAELPAVQQQIVDLNDKIAAVRKQLTEAQVVHETAQTVTDQPDWSILLSILGSAISDDVALREINLKPNPKDKKQYIVELRGFSRTQPGVSQFVIKLQQVGLFDDVKLLRTGREPVLNVSAITFDLACEIRDGGKQGQP